MAVDAIHLSQLSPRLPSQLNTCQPCQGRISRQSWETYLSAVPWHFGSVQQEWQGPSREGPPEKCRWWQVLKFLSSLLQGGVEDLNGNGESTGRESGDPKHCFSVASCCAHSSRRRLVTCYPVVGLAQAPRIQQLGIVLLGSPLQKAMEDAFWWARIYCWFTCCASIMDIKCSFDRRMKEGRRNVLPALVDDAVISVIPAKGR